MFVLVRQMPNVVLTQMGISAAPSDMKSDMAQTRAHANLSVYMKRDLNM
jgi:hypothetical protein